MQFGIAVATDSDSWKAVQRAEELGFSHAWFYDTQMLCADCFVAMGAAAVKTSRIRLGTGVLIPSNRIAPVTAGAFASLNKLAPGRIDFGVGTGFTGRRAMGFGAMKLRDMESYLHTIYGLLREETVPFTFEGQQTKIRFLNPDLGLINTRDPIALHISAYGPRAQALTAKLKAGWLNFVGDPNSGIDALQQMRAPGKRPVTPPQCPPSPSPSAASCRKASPTIPLAPWPRPAPVPPCCCTARRMQPSPACPTLRTSRKPSPRPSPPMSNWRKPSNPPTPNT